MSPSSNSRFAPSFPQPARSFDRRVIIVAVVVFNSARCLTCRCNFRTDRQAPDSAFCIAPGESARAHVSCDVVSDSPVLCLRATVPRRPRLRRLQQVCIFQGSAACLRTDFLNTCLQGFRCFARATSRSRPLRCVCTRFSDTHVLLSVCCLCAATGSSMCRRLHTQRRTSPGSVTECESAFCRGKSWTMTADCAVLFLQVLDSPRDRIGQPATVCFAA